MMTSITSTPYFAGKVMVPLQDGQTSAGLYQSICNSRVSGTPLVEELVNNLNYSGPQTAVLTEGAYLNNSVSLKSELLDKGTRFMCFDNNQSKHEADYALALAFKLRLPEDFSVYTVPHNSRHNKNLSIEA